MRVDVFCVFSCIEDFLHKGVNVWDEEVIMYNWIDVSSMSKSKNGRPFHGIREVHHVSLQALIEVCF
jgi:hypothetical protein